MQILWHFPQTQNKSFKPQYDHIQWINNKEDFEKWCSGKQDTLLLMLECEN